MIPEISHLLTILAAGLFLFSFLVILSSNASSSTDSIIRLSLNCFNAATIFLIFAFLRTLGGYAVLPMIATYAVLHFGKPLTEAVSSVFGGYLLGILSYNTRSVWGGIMIHMGIAWLMELFGYLHRLM